jgi:hypothetical protein
MISVAPAQEKDRHQNEHPMPVVGEGWISAQSTKTILERALEEERTEHWAMRPATRPGGGRGTARTGPPPSGC